MLIVHSLLPYLLSSSLSYTYTLTRTCMKTTVDKKSTNQARPQQLYF